MHRLILTCSGTQGDVRWRGVSSLIAAWMTVGLLIAGAFAALAASSPLALRVVHRAAFVFLLLLLLQLGAAIVVSMMIGRFSTWQAVALLFAYSALNGLSLSGLFLALWHTSLTATFVIEAAAFGLLSVYGKFTRRDLTKIDGLVLMGLIGVGVASLVHLLLHSPAGFWIISYVGIAIFVCLMAIDAQKMRHMDVRADELRVSRLAILGALVLYLDVLLGFARLCVAIGRLYLDTCEKQYSRNPYPYTAFHPMGF